MHTNSSGAPKVSPRHLAGVNTCLPRLPIRISAKPRLVIQVLPNWYIRTSSRRETFFFFSITNHNAILQDLSRCLPASSQSSSKPSSIIFTINFIMSFALRGPSKRKGDLADSFPLVGRCLKCFKNMIVDPFTLCPIAPGKKNCERCNKGSESCGLVSASPLCSTSTNIGCRFLDPFRKLAGLGKTPLWSSRNSLKIILNIIIMMMKILSTGSSRTGWRLTSSGTPLRVLRSRTRTRLGLVFRK